MPHHDENNPSLDRRPDEMASDRVEVCKIGGVTVPMSHKDALHDLFKNGWLIFPSGVDTNKLFGEFWNRNCGTRDTAGILKDPEFESYHQAVTYNKDLKRILSECDHPDVLIGNSNSMANPTYSSPGHNGKYLYHLTTPGNPGIEIDVIALGGPQVPWTFNYIPLSHLGANGSAETFNTKGNTIIVKFRTFLLTAPASESQSFSIVTPYILCNVDNIGNLRITPPELGINKAYQEGLAAKEKVDIIKINGQNNLRWKPSS